MRKRCVAVCMGAGVLLALLALICQATGVSVASSAPRAGDVQANANVWSPYLADDADGWTNIISDTFEGEFPGQWIRRNHPDYWFGKRDCRAHGGVYAAWCVGESRAGPNLPCNGYFPPQTVNPRPSIMESPVFSLEGAWDAELSFWYRSDCSFPNGISTLVLWDGRHHAQVDLPATSGGDSPEGWSQLTVDLERAFELGDLLGLPEVGFEFTSIVWRGDCQGLFVDDVLVRAKFGAPPVTPTVTPTETMTPTLTPSPTATMTRIPNQLNLPLIVSKWVLPQDGTPTSTPTATVLPTLTHTPTLTPTPVDGPGWHDMFAEDFEGDFPGRWEVSDDSEEDGGEYEWGKRDCRARESTYSAWCVGGGDAGSQVPCGVDYPNGVDTWMVYGPFEMPEVENAFLVFYLFKDTENLFDTLSVGASLDNETYWMGQDSGYYNGWIPGILNLKDMGEGGDFSGQPEVWIAFRFQSDQATALEGVFVDDVTISWCNSDCVATSVLGRDASLESPWMVEVQSRVQRSRDVSPKSSGVVRP